jgi:hypothetical protein
MVKVLETRGGGTMNKKMRLLAGLAIAGVVAAGGVAVAVPAIAGAGPVLPDSDVAADTNPGWQGHSRGPGDGMGMRDGTGMGLGDGTCRATDTVASGTLTEEQAATLAAMAEEEKLAGDLYQAFADKYELVILGRIAAAEDRHLAAVRNLLDRYGLDDPSAGKAAGKFTTPDVQATYDKLLAEGLTSQSAALNVGRQVEQADIAELEQALNGLTAPDVQTVYQHLLTASRRHLAAFDSWATR